MSAKAFRDLFNNQEFLFWYKKELAKPDPKSTSFIGIGRQDAKGFVKTTVGDFVLSKEKLVEIFGESTAQKLISAVQTNTLELFDVATYRQVSGQEQIFFPDIKFDKATKQIQLFLTQIAQTANLNPGFIATRLDEYFENKPQDVGHVFGFTNTLLIRAKSSAREELLKSADKKLKSAKYIGDIKGIKEAEEYLKLVTLQLDSLDRVIDTIVDIIEEYDITTSEIKGLDLPINLKYRKTAKNWLFTWETGKEQQAVGSKLSNILGQIKQAKTSAEGSKGIRGLFASLFNINKNDDLVKNLLNNLVKDFVDKTIANPKDPRLNILTQETSPELVSLINDKIREAFGNKPIYKAEYTGSVDLKPITARRVSKKLVSNSTVSNIKSLKTKIKSTKSKVITELKSVKNVNIETTNLLRLQNLINSSLHDQIRSNMGTGDRRDVLNYRTGRFANSAKVERLSESRQGMITAFYSYMRNPYATFSKGGRQERPLTRDPKLLISKSIRELAQPMVANRMRAVLV